MNGNKPPTEQQAQQEREKFVTAFNDTMLRIWQEQITLLGVIDGRTSGIAQGVAGTRRRPLLRGRIVSVLPRNLRLSESNAKLV